MNLLLKYVMGIILINVFILLIFTPKDLSLYKNYIWYLYNLNYSDIKYLLIQFAGVKSIGNLNIDIAIIYIIYRILFVLLLPFLSVLLLIFINLGFKFDNVNTLVQATTCMIGYDSAIKNKDVMLKNSKLFWYNVFPKYNINTPKVFAIYKNNKLDILDESFDSNTKYIVKPNDGTLGARIEFTTYNDFLKKRSDTQETYLFQERIYDIHPENEGRYFRYITVYNKKTNTVNDLIFKVYETKKKDKGSIVSTTMNGASKRSFRDLNDPYFTDIEKKYLKNITAKLKNLHATKFPYSVNFGWDIMLQEDGPVVLEGNFCHGTVLDKETTKRYINMLK